jgi:hypothetical protein
MQDSVRAIFHVTRLSVYALNLWVEFEGGIGFSFEVGPRDVLGIMWHSPSFQMISVI